METFVFLTNPNINNIQDDGFMFIHRHHHQGQERNSKSLEIFRNNSVQ
jgi:hypothetical protein